jgi:hypothetical protein
MSYYWSKISQNEFEYPIQNIFVSYSSRSFNQQIEIFLIVCGHFCCYWTFMIRNFKPWSVVNNSTNNNKGNNQIIEHTKRPQHLTLEIQFLRCTQYNIMWSSLSVTCEAGLWFSPCTMVSFTSKIDCHDITDILLKVALNFINQTSKM